MLDDYIQALIKAYVEKDQVQRVKIFDDLEKLGMDKYTAIEVAMNLLPEYIATNHINTLEEIKKRRAENERNT